MTGVAHDIVPDVDVEGRPLADDGARRRAQAPRTLGDADEERRRGRKVCRAREGDAVVAFALTTARAVDADRRGREQRRIDTDAQLVVVGEAAADADVEG